MIQFLFRIGRKAAEVWLLLMSLCFVLKNVVEIGGRTEALSGKARLYFKCGRLLSRPHFKGSLITSNTVDTRSTCLLTCAWSVCVHARTVCYFVNLRGYWLTLKTSKEKKKREKSGGCIVRESKGGVIRPNGSQMAGCQWREKRDELLIGTRRSQTPLNCRWESAQKREGGNQTLHRPSVRFWPKSWQRKTGSTTYTLHCTVFVFISLKQLYLCQSQKSVIVTPVSFYECTVEVFFICTRSHPDLYFWTLSRQQKQRSNTWNKAFNNWWTFARVFTENLDIFSYIWTQAKSLPLTVLNFFFTNYEHL